MLHRAAGLLVVLPLATSACGSVADTGADASPAADAAPADPTVEVTVYSDNDADAGQPNTAAYVVFTGPTGAVVAEGTVDGSGRASAAMPDGGRVMALRRDDTSLGVAIIEDVAPGDRLHVGLPPAIGKVGAARTATVTFPDPSNPHTVYTRCGTTAAAPGASSASVTLYAGCEPADEVTLAIGRDVGGPQFATMPATPWTGGGSVAAPDAYVAPGAYALSVSGVPVGVGRADLQHATSLGGTTVTLDFTSIEAPGVGAFTQELAGATGSGLRVTDEVTYCVAGSTAEHRVARARYGSLLAGGLDLGQAPPEASTPVVGAAGVSWTTTGDGPADLTLVQWLMAWDDGAGARSASIIVMRRPDAPTSIAMPTMPAAFAADVPSAGSTFIYNGAHVHYVDNAFDDGYAAAKDFVNVYEYGYFKIADVRPTAGDDLVQRRTFNSSFSTSCEL